MYFYDTRIGRFHIANINDRWHAIFEGDSPGSYAFAHQASEDLAGGHTHWPNGIDPSRLGIPAEIGERETLR